MRTSAGRWLVWTPRVLGIVFALFLGLFALDVFEEGRGFGPTLLALLIHLVPTFLILGVLALAWRRAWVGAAVFTALGAWYVVSGWGRLHWSAHLVIAGPLFALGALFLLAWVRRAELGLVRSA